MRLPLVTGHFPTMYLCLLCIFHKPGPAPSGLSPSYQPTVSTLSSPLFHHLLTEAQCAKLSPCLEHPTRRASCLKPACCCVLRNSEQTVRPEHALAPCLLCVHQTLPFLSVLTIPPHLVLPQVYFSVESILFLKKKHWCKIHIT